MKWFKHLTRSKSDPDIMESEILFKSQGPYVFWRLLEILSDENAIDTPLIMNFKVFKMWFPSVTVAKLVIILTYFRDKNRIIFKFIDMNIKISCIKFSVISSDYASKVRRESEQCSKSVRKMSTLDIEVEVDKEKDKKENIIKEKPAGWKTDFSKYIKLVKNAYNQIISNSEEMIKQQKFHPDVDIKLSLDKMIHNFWGTEAGWKNKKSKRSKTIDMKRTLINNIDKNRVFKKKEAKKWGLV
jgi:hypothetical protein